MHNAHNLLPTLIVTGKLSFYDLYLANSENPWSILKEVFFQGGDRVTKYIIKSVFTLDLTQRTEKVSFRALYGRKNWEKLERNGRWRRRIGALGVGEFNIICKSNGNTATLLMIDTSWTHIGAWTYYMGSRKLPCKRRGSKFYAALCGWGCERGASKGYEPMNANERRSGRRRWRGASAGADGGGLSVDIYIKP